jgi:hypothetical protein
MVQARRFRYDCTWGYRDLAERLYTPHLHDHSSFKEEIGTNDRHDAMPPVASNPDGPTVITIIPPHPPLLHNNSATTAIRAALDGLQGMG